MEWKGEGMRRALTGPYHYVEESIGIQIGQHRRAAQDTEGCRRDPLRESADRRSRGTPRVDRRLVVRGGYDVELPITIDIAYRRGTVDRSVVSGSLRPALKAAPVGVPDVDVSLGIRGEDLERRIPIKVGKRDPSSQAS